MEWIASDFSVATNTPGCNTNRSISWPSTTLLVAETYWIEGLRFRAVWAVVFGFFFWIPGAFISTVAFIRYIRRIR